MNVQFLLMQTLEQLDERALPEWAAFAATLARKLADLLPRGRVALGDPVWTACVDNFLLKAVDIDSQVGFFASLSAMEVLCWNVVL